MLNRLNQPDEDEKGLSEHARADLARTIIKLGLPVELKPWTLKLLESDDIALIVARYVINDSGAKRMIQPLLTHISIVMTLKHGAANITDFMNAGATIHRMRNIPGEEILNNLFGWIVEALDNDMIYFDQKQFLFIATKKALSPENIFHAQIMEKKVAIVQDRRPQDFSVSDRKLEIREETPKLYELRRETEAAFKMDFPALFEVPLPTSQ